MRALKVLVLLSLIGFLAVGCGDDDEGASGPTASVPSPAEDESDLPPDDAEEGEVATTVTTDDDGATVELVAGQLVEVSLDQCIGCGYVWEVVSDLDEEVLELVEETDLEADQEPGMVGGETTHVKTFRATGAGTLEVQIGHIPPGEETPEETVTYTFDVS